MGERRYRESRQVTLDANGFGSAFISPQRHGEKYIITGVGTQGTSSVEPEFKVYEGGVDDGNFRTGTYTGNSDADNEFGGIELWAGEKLSVAWFGGSVGAVMVASFFGMVVTDGIQ